MDLGGLACPLKGDVLVSRSALSLLSALSRLCSLKGPGGWAPHGPGQTGFQGGLAGGWAPHGPGRSGWSTER